MAKRFIIALFACVFALSCDDSSSNKTDADLMLDIDQNDTDTTVITDTTDALIPDEDGIIPGEDDVVADVDTAVPTCADLKDGENKLIVNGEESQDLERTFILTLPTTINDKKGWPVIFNFHGYGDTAANFEGLLSSYVNNTEMPFILVTPEDTNLAINQFPPAGVDWDILDLGNGSIEVEMFDAILACIEEKWGVDEDHIHLAGFSAGSITSDSIGVMRGDQIASIFTYSGAYFSDAKAKTDLGSMASGFITWPEMTTTNKYAQAMMHGAEGDANCTSPTVCDKWGSSGFFINFNHMARFNANYLTGMGHTVIICDHNGGHTNLGLSSQQMLEFFRDHPRGTTVSPYATDWPENYPEYCKLMTEPDPTIEPGYVGSDDDSLMPD